MDKRILRVLEPGAGPGFLESAVHNSHIMDTLKATVSTILTEKQKALAKDDYDVANWSHLAADRNGEIRAYRDMLSLLESIKHR